MESDGARNVMQTVDLVALADVLAIGEAAEFTSLYHAEATKLLGFLIKLGADVHLAADIVQATFEDLLGTWGTIDHPRAWMRRVAERKLMRARDPARRKEDPVDDFLDTDRLILLGHSDLMFRPDTALEFSEEAQRVLRMIAELPRSQRLVLAWDMDGYTTSEIATNLRMTQVAVRQNLSRARSALKQKLTGGDGA